MTKGVLMKAIVCTRYGPPEVLQFKEVEQPTPNDNEVLVRLFAVVVGTEDSMQRKGRPYFGRLFVGFTKPRKPILGTEFAGSIAAVGRNVTLFKPGDEVFGSTGSRFGCYAEYMCIPEEGFLSRKLPGMTFAEAAPICGSLAAWNLLHDKAHVLSGQRVIIADASGSIGSAAVQIAKALGAEVTGVSRTDDLEFVRSLGADRAIGPLRRDIADDGDIYDVVLDVDGRPSFSHYRKVLKPRGVYLTTYPTLGILLRMVFTRCFASRRVVFSATGLLPVSRRLGFLGDLSQLFEERQVTPIVDRHYRLDQMVEAHQYIEQGHSRGNVVVVQSEEGDGLPNSR
jgi:NADPH:quinone reductase-like Zn-dependent oxidoreductase